MSLKTMALIPEGNFIMGSNNGPDDEKPQHTIFIKLFYLDILPVSNADFAQFLNHQGLQNQQGEVLYDHQDSDARIHRRNSVWQEQIIAASKGDAPGMAKLQNEMPKIHKKQ